MAAGGRRRGLITDINVTPLVDIMLVLLIIFMLTAHLIARQVIEVQLPKAAQAADGNPTTLAVTLTREGRMFLNGVPTKPDALRAAIQVSVAKDAKTQVIVAGDKNVSHGRVVWVLDLVKSLGVTSFAIQIDPAGLLAPVLEE
jgi:biopolymer transport protein ExbD